LQPELQRVDAHPAALRLLPADIDRHRSNQQAQPDLANPTQRRFGFVGLPDVHRRRLRRSGGSTHRPKSYRVGRDGAHPAGSGGRIVVFMDPAPQPERAQSTGIAWRPILRRVVILTVTGVTFYFVLPVLTEAFSTFPQVTKVAPW